MKLGIETRWVRHFFGDEEAMRLIGEAGFDCVDYSFFDAPAALDGNYAAYARHMRGVMEQAGLVCNQTHAPFRFRYGDGMTPEEPTFCEILRAMEAASILGAKYIVVHSVLPPAEVDLTDYNLCFFKSLEPYCAQFGIQVGFENIFDYDPQKRCMGRFGTPERVKGFLAALQSPWFVACLDTGHAAIGGTKPEDFVRGLDAQTLRLLHVQDTDFIDDRHQLPYMGFHDWSAFTLALAEIGYTGDLTFEIPGYLRRMDKELVPAALAFAAATGWHLIAKIEQARAEAPR